MSAIREQLASTSYGQLAKRAGCTKAMVSLIMHGQRTPSMELIGKLAKALRCSTEDLMSELGLAAGRSHNWMGRQLTSTVKIGRRKAA